MLQQHWRHSMTAVIPTDVGCILNHYHLDHVDCVKNYANYKYLKMLHIKIRVPLYQLDVHAISINIFAMQQ